MPTNLSCRIEQQLIECQLARTNNNIQSGYNQLNLKMYSDNFVQHMFEKTNELISIERNKRARAHDKLDYNLKRMLDHLPQELKQMKVEQLLNDFNGDLDAAADKLVKIETPSVFQEKAYHSPPKNQSKKRNLKNKLGN